MSWLGADRDPDPGTVNQLDANSSSGIRFVLFLCNIRRLEDACLMIHFHFLELCFPCSLLFLVPFLGCCFPLCLVQISSLCHCDHLRVSHCAACLFPPSSVFQPMRSCVSDQHPTFSIRLFVFVTPGSDPFFGLYPVSLLYCSNFSSLIRISSAALHPLCLWAHNYSLILIIIKRCHS